jgi:lycopene cyclase domain-containing protein
MTYTYLIITAFLLLIPFCFTIDSKIFNVRQLKSAVIPSIIVALIFSGIAAYFTLQKIWVFNPAYLLGIYYLTLPLEGFLFLFAFSFAGLGIYNYLNAKFPNNELQKYSLALSNLFLGVFVAILFFFHNKWFPLITVSVVMILLLGIEYINKLRFMYRFYRAFAACLIPFYIVYGLIGNLPIITYNKLESIGVSPANIPFENHFYMMGMLLLGVYLVELLKNRSTN